MPFLYRDVYVQCVFWCFVAAGVIPTSSGTRRELNFTFRIVLAGVTRLEWIA